MSKNENVNETINYEELEIGKPYVVSLTSGAVISGILFSKREDLQNGNVVKEYGIMFDNATQVYLCDCQITKIREVKPIDTDFFKELENEYDIQCFDENEELLPSSKILGNILCIDRIWGKLSKRKKKKLIRNLNLGEENIISVIERCINEMNRITKLYNARIKVLNDYDFNRKYCDVKELLSQLEKTYKLYHQQ